MTGLPPWRVGPVLLGILAASIMAYVALGTYLQAQASIFIDGATHARAARAHRK